MAGGSGRRDHPVGPFDGRREALLAVQPEGSLVARLDRQLDLGQAGRTQVGHAPAQELAAQAAPAPIGQQTDDADLTPAQAVVAG